MIAREIYMELWNGRKEKVILLTIEKEGESGRNREIRPVDPAVFSNSSSPPD